MNTFIVAGGNSGIGYQLVSQLIEQGNTVYNLDINIDKSHPEALNLIVDLRNEKEVEKLIQKIFEDAQHVAGIAAIAGIGYTTELEDLSPDQFNIEVTCNLNMIFNLISHCVPHLKPGSSIVTVSSTCAYGATGMSAGYAAGKAGVIGLTKQLAFELGSKKIRVNAVVPGPIDTELAKGLSSSTERRLLKELTPLKELGAPEDVANSIRFLLLNDSKHITGQSLVIDGGLTLSYRPALV